MAYPSATADSEALIVTGSHKLSRSPNEDLFLK